jgi:protein SCO1/2
MSGKGWLISLLLAGTAHGLTGGRPADLGQRVGVDPAIGRQVPVEARFRDERGLSMTLAEVIAGRPAVVALVYFDCPNLCTMTLNGLSTSVQHIGPRPPIDYRVIAISIDPHEGPALAAAKRDDHIARFGRGAPGCPGCDADWHFLTGEEGSIREVARALGYRYYWDSGTAQYAHPAGAVVLSGAGRIVQYLNGLEFPPAELQRALELAAAGRSGTLTDRLWLLCYHFEALAGRYGQEVTGALRLLGLATVLALGFLLFRLGRFRA